MTVDMNLLMHWWQFYNRDLYTLEERECFEKLIDKYGVDKIFECAIASFISDDGSPMAILSCIRCNCFEKLIATLPDISEFSDDAKSDYNKFCETFINEVSSTM